jgi:SAM-dependent methyltransferase
MPPTAPPPRSPPRLLALLAVVARSVLRRLADLLVPASFQLFELVGGVGLTEAIGAAARLRLADHLAAAPRTAEELATLCGVPEETLHRMLRGLVSVGVFTYRRRDQRFHNNRLSRTLRSDQPVSLRDWSVYFSTPSHVQAWADFDATLRTGESAFARVHGMSVWKWLALHPAEREVFGGAMVALTGLFATGVATAYPFGEIRRLCDVGGGTGVLLASILLRHRQLQAVLFDGSVEAATRVLASAGVADRVDRQVGDFFDFVPGGCDAYLLKNILHDWDDERALRILRNCRQVMKPGNRLLVVESVVERTTMHGFGPLSDLQMLVICDGGRERGEADFAKLFGDAGFRLQRVVATSALFMSVIEGIAV